MQAGGSRRPFVYRLGGREGEGKVPPSVVLLYSIVAVETSSQSDPSIQKRLLHVGRGKLSQFDTSLRPKQVMSLAGARTQVQAQGFEIISGAAKYSFFCFLDQCWLLANGPCSSGKSLLAIPSAAASG
jgi:hypothetical protein